MDFIAGEGYDCQFGISGSFSGFGNISPRGGKISLNAKKKVLTDGLGITRGYKYYDPSEEATVDFWIQGGTGDTGTLQITKPAIGSAVSVTACSNNQLTGSWSLDKIELTLATEDVAGGSMTISRFTNVTIS